MRLIIFRQTRDRTARAEAGLLSYALSAAPLDRVILGALDRRWCWVDNSAGFARLTGTTKPGTTRWAVPRRWQVHSSERCGQSIAYTDVVGIDTETRRAIHKDPWFTVSNGRFAARMNCRLVEQMLVDGTADAIAVTATPELAAYRERVRLTEDGRLVGYRRLHGDSAEPAPVPTDWPHHLFLRREIIDTVFADGVPSEFTVVAERCRAHHLDLKSLAVAGVALDLDSEEGLLSLGTMALADAPLSGTDLRPVNGQHRAVASGHGHVSPQSRFLGPVLLGSHVCVESGAIIIGPSILCNDSIVRAGAVVESSIVGVGTVVPEDRVLRHSVAVIQHEGRAQQHSTPGIAYRPQRPTRSEGDRAFRTWPKLSYAGCAKRVVDSIAAIIVLALFAPIIPFIALAVKISSPGPVFFIDKRQGLHGRLFNCIKFRTMRVGADQMQDKLRFVSEVDGPQFKIVDDPRITTVGRFLRETYLDEIPQFCNVLAGDMSVVGPRPSPESENTLCPWWRDARLSIRPGITGLWQVCRTRQPMKDFQEWIHYDTQYVRELSLRLDLWICWRTFGKMVRNFIRQF